MALWSSKRSKSSKSSPTKRRVPPPDVDTPPKPSKEEIERQLSKLMDAMAIPPGEKRESMRNMNIDTKWLLICQQKSLIDMADSQADDPLDIISEIRSNPSAKVIRELRVNLTSKPVSWVGQFLDGDGLDAILEAAQRSEMRGLAGGAVRKEDADLDEMDLEIVLCLKGIMNNRMGLHAVMDKPDVVKELVRYIASARTQQTALELCACISISPPDGHTLVMEGLKRVKLLARKRNRFSVLLDVLTDNVFDGRRRPELAQWMLTLINALVNYPDSLETRTHYRRELNDIGFEDMLNRLKSLHFEKLDMQIKVYEEYSEMDVQETAELDELGVGLGATPGAAGAGGVAGGMNDIYNMLEQTIRMLGDDDLESALSGALKDFLFLASCQHKDAGRAAFLSATRNLHKLSTQRHDAAKLGEAVRRLESGASALDSPRAVVSGGEGSGSAALRVAVADSTGEFDAMNEVQQNLEAVREERRLLNAQLTQTKAKLSAKAHDMDALEQRVAVLESELEAERTARADAEAAAEAAATQAASSAAAALAASNTGLPSFASPDQIRAAVGGADKLPSLPGVGLPGFGTQAELPSLPALPGADSITTPAPAAEAAPESPAKKKPDTSALEGLFGGGAPPAKKKPDTSALEGLFGGGAPPAKKKPDTSALEGLFGGGAPPAKKKPDTSALEGLFGGGAPPAKKKPDTSALDGLFGGGAPPAKPAATGGDAKWGLHPSAIPPPVMPEPGSICSKGPAPEPATQTYADLAGAGAGGAQKWGMHPSAIAPPVMPEPGSICSKGPAPPPATQTYADLAGAGGAASSGNGSRLPRKKNVKPAVMTKRVQWAKIDDNAAAGTCWADLGKEDVPVDEEMILDLFKTVRRTVAAPKDDGKPKVESLLSGQVTQMVGIAQNQFKISLDDMVKALRAGDDSVLDIGHLRSLAKLCAHEEAPISTCAAYDGDISKLGKPEQFCHALSTVPDLARRLDVWIFRRRFGGAVAELQPDLHTATTAFKVLRDSAKFKRILQLVLAIGNVLNGGSRNGGAYGFKLETLTNLQMTKDVNRETLLHTIIRILQRTDRAVARDEIDLATGEIKEDVKKKQKKAKKKAAAAAEKAIEEAKRAATAAVEARAAAAELGVADAPPAFTEEEAADYIAKAEATARKTQEERAAAAAAAAVMAGPDPYADRDPLESDLNYDPVAEALAGMDECYPTLLFLREFGVFQLCSRISLQMTIQEVSTLDTDFKGVQKKLTSIPHEGDEDFFKKMDDFVGDSHEDMKSLMEDVAALEKLYADVGSMYGEDIDSPDAAEELLTMMRTFRDNARGALTEVDQARIKAERDAARKAKREEQAKKRTAAVSKAKKAGRVRHGPKASMAARKPKSSLFEDGEEGEPSFVRKTNERHRTGTNPLAAAAAAAAQRAKDKAAAPPAAKAEAPPPAHTREPSKAVVPPLPVGDAAPAAAPEPAPAEPAPAEPAPATRRLGLEMPNAEDFAEFADRNTEAQFVARGHALTDLATRTETAAADDEEQGLLDDLIGALSTGGAFSNMRRNRPGKRIARGRR